jgi:hypothetical protein
LVRKNLWQALWYIRPINSGVPNSNVGENVTAEIPRGFGLMLSVSTNKTIRREITKFASWARSTKWLWRSWCGLGVVRTILMVLLFIER